MNQFVNTMLNNNNTFNDNNNNNNTNNVDVDNDDDEMQLNTQWMKRVENEIITYSDFQQTPVNKVRVTCYYLDDSGKQIQHKRTFEHTLQPNGVITAHDMNLVYTKYNTCAKRRYSKKHILLYQVANISPDHLAQCLQSGQAFDSYIKKRGILTEWFSNTPSLPQPASYTFESCIHMWQDLNEIIIFYTPIELDATTTTVLPTKSENTKSETNTTTTQFTFPSSILKTSRHYKRRDGTTTHSKQVRFTLRNKMM